MSERFVGLFKVGPLAQLRLTWSYSRGLGYIMETVSVPVYLIDTGMLVDDGALGVVVIVQ